MADDAVAGLDDGEELLLDGDLGVVAVAEGDPAAPLLRHPLHLGEPPLPERLQVVVVEAVEGGDLLVDLVLHGLGHGQDLLLDDLEREKARKLGGILGDGAGPTIRIRERDRTTGAPLELWGSPLMGRATKGSSALRKQMEMAMAMRRASDREKESAFKICRNIE